MGEICPKTKSYPPLIKQELISTPPHIMIILSLTPPLKKKSPPIDSTNITSNDSSTYVEESSEWTLSLCRLPMNWTIPHLLQHLWH